MQFVLAVDDNHGRLKQLLRKNKTFWLLKNGWIKRENVFCRSIEQANLNYGMENSRNKQLVLTGISSFYIIVPLLLKGEWILSYNFGLDPVFANIWATPKKFLASNEENKFER